ncbi:hypothetical protein ABVK25_002431 [Lepraria finkii]|uniref:Uncharacterized protein n=1 Tax=Lepraria finkii TaxID=1340010 RepID=A0ABR4BIB3_9LECA
MKKTHIERLVKRVTATPRRRATATCAPASPKIYTPAPPVTYAPPTPARRAPKTRLPAVRTPETSATPLQKLVIALPVRITNGELARRQQRAREQSSNPIGQPLGRGQRTRQPRKAYICI